MPSIIVGGKKIQGTEKELREFLESLPDVESGKKADGNIVQNAIRSQRTSVGPLTPTGAFTPTTGQEALDVGRVAARAIIPQAPLVSPASGFTGVGSRLSGSPETLPHPRQIIEPQTDFGKQLDIGIAAGQLAAPGIMAAKGIGKFFNPDTVDIVKDIQRNFFPFVRQGTRRFGEALRKGKRLLKQQGLSPEVAADEIETIFSPINNASDDIAKQIPSQARIAAKVPQKGILQRKATSEDLLIRGGAQKTLSTETPAKNLTIDDLLKRKAQLRTTLTKAERLGKNTTPKSEAIKESLRRLDATIRSKIPGIEKANTEYALFIRTKELLEKVDPQLARMDAPFGTRAGTKFLKQIAGFEPEDIALLKRFENAQSLNIVGPAQRSAVTRRLIAMVTRLAEIGVTIGALKAAGADRLFFQAVDASN